MLTISSAEWEVMRVLWAKGQATSSEIIAILAKKLDWSASTVKTLLGRLADKGYLTSQRQGRGFIYQASLGEDEANFQALEAVGQEILLPYVSFLDYFKDNKNYSSFIELTNNCFGEEANEILRYFKIQEVSEV